jgi:acyl carrier protein
MLGLEEILSRVKPAVAESLGIEVTEIQPSQTFFGDLGGESIEWLDLSFRLDKEFGLRLPGLGSLGGIETDAEGRFTANGFVSLASFMPASLIDRVKDRSPAATAKELVEAITVDDIAGMVELALESKRAVASP